MAWIESHTVLLRHPKLVELAREARLKPVYVLGHLHSLWHNVLEQREDGDLSSWSEDFIAEACAWRGDAHQWVSLLEKHRWLDGRLVHDWLDYAGSYLTRKYGGGSIAGKNKLKTIWALHGREYGSEQLVSRKCATSEQKVTATVPDLTVPNQLQRPVVYSNDYSSILQVVWKIRGEHYGKRVIDLPADYCKWALKNMDSLGKEYRFALAERVELKQQEVSGPRSGGFQAPQKPEGL